MLKAVKEVIGNTIPTNNIVSIFGDTQIGKTTLATQIVHDIAKTTGKPALIYDTEGGVTDTVQSLKCDDLVEIHQADDIRDILHDHGFKVEIKITEMMIIKMREILKETDTPILRSLQKKKYCAIVYDSFTAPLKVFGYGQENQTSKSNAQWLWNKGITAMQRKFPCSVIQLHHSTYPKSKDDKKDEPVKAQMIGGWGLQYASKYICRLEKIHDTADRILTSTRHPYHAPEARKAVIRLKNGFHDI